MLNSAGFNDKALASERVASLETARQVAAAKDINHGRDTVGRAAIGALSPLSDALWQADNGTYTLL